MFRNLCTYLTVFSMFFSAAYVAAQENGNREKARGTKPTNTGSAPVVTLSATVKGNQEQPKVLYIVPWQAAQDHKILYEPLNSQTNRVFGHVERVEHQRELNFISELGGSTDQAK